MKRMRYHLLDKSGNMTVNADYPNEDGELVIQMTMKPKQGVAIEEVFNQLGWTVVGKVQVRAPKLLKFPPTKGE